MQFTQPNLQSQPIPLQSNPEVKSEEKKNHEQKKEEEEEEDTKYDCQICFENKVSHTFECGHVVCGVCSEELLKQRKCPFCKSPIDKAIKLFFI